MKKSLEWYLLLQGALGKQSMLLIAVGKKLIELQLHAVKPCITAFSPNSSPSICAFNKCAAATLEFACLNQQLICIEFFFFISTCSAPSFKPSRRRSGSLCGCKSSLPFTKSEGLLGQQFKVASKR